MRTNLLDTPLDTPARRSPARALATLGILLALLVQIGCAASNSVPEITSTPYAGPELSLNREGRTAVVVLAAPTPGWRVGVDRVVESFQRRDIFLTIQPPDPKYMYAQVIVEQRVATNVEANVTASLYARVLDADPTKGGDKPYSLVSVSTVEDWKLIQGIEPQKAPEPHPASN